MSIWFRLQVNKNQNKLYAICYQMLQDSLEAEEVVQDCFIKLWQAKENGTKQPKAWLFQVAASILLGSPERALARSSLLTCDGSGLPSKIDAAT